MYILQIVNYLILILSLPTEKAAVRQRAWRALKASGAAVLRDGVYLMPAKSGCQEALEAVASDVTAGGGVAHILPTEAPSGADFEALFDRSDAYAALMTEIAAARAALNADTVSEALKRARRLRKAFAAIDATDFFAVEARRQAEAVLTEFELACARVQCPNEPHAVAAPIRRLDSADYRGQLWATRRRPWVDRLASAWLIRRYIDPEAHILWLTDPAECPKEALGFDFDGAVFSHVGARVSFEVLLASFGLEQAALVRLGQLVHFLDVGGAQPTEAAGVEAILAGLRAGIEDDDQLLDASLLIFDGLVAAFDRGEAS